MIRRLTLLLLCFSALASAATQNPAKASLIAETEGFNPGQALTVALRIEPEPHWHTYWSDPGDAGLPTSIEFTLPDGLKASDILWPKPMVFKDPGGLIGYGYEGDTILPVEIKIPASYSATTLEIKAKASWLVCHNVCIPGSANLVLDLPRSSGPSAQAALFATVRPSLGIPPDGYKGATADQGAPMPSPEKAPQQAKPSEKTGTPKVTAPMLAVATPAGVSQPAQETPAPEANASLLLMLFFAFVGGLILNLMPCVLPVLSLKVMTFIRQSGESRGRSMALGGAFSLGAISSFWVLAAVVIGARAAGQSVGWGFQFQSPVFVSVMAVIVTAFALNLFGIFEIYIPGQATQVIHEAGTKEGLPGAFFTGAFMTVLATPCTAPFLGTALGFAFSQSSFTLFMIFTAAGLGLATPYQLFSSFPKLMRWIPKPGKWMLYFKQLMGFPLLATLCWLLWVLGKQTSVEIVIWMLAYLLVLALACWIYGTFAPLGSTWRRLLTVGAINLALMVGGYQFLLSEPFHNGLGGVAPVASNGWEPYSTARIAELQKQGKTVFVDFTAEWCWTCKVNERVALNNADVQDAFGKSGIIKMRADWTRGDPAITAALNSFHRSGVPFYVFYSPKLQAPVTLAEVITPGAVLSAIQKCM